MGGRGEWTASSTRGGKVGQGQVCGRERGGRRVESRRKAAGKARSPNMLYAANLSGFSSSSSSSSEKVFFGFGRTITILYFRTLWSHASDHVDLPEQILPSPPLYQVLSASVI